MIISGRQGGISDLLHMFHFGTHGELKDKVDFFVQTKEPPLQGVFYDGQLWDARVLVLKLVSIAKRSLILIDNWATAESAHTISVTTHTCFRHGEFWRLGDSWDAGADLPNSETPRSGSNNRLPLASHLAPQNKVCDNRSSGGVHKRRVMLFYLRFCPIHANFTHPASDFGLNSYNSRHVVLRQRTSVCTIVEAETDFVTRSSP